MHQSTLNQPIFMSLNFYMQIPESASKKKQDALLGIPHDKRPDLDNLIKFVLDVCNGLLFKDDAQVVKITAAKTWSKIPRTDITLCPMLDSYLKSIGLCGC